MLKLCKQNGQTFSMQFKNMNLTFKPKYFLECSSALIAYPKTRYFLVVARQSEKPNIVGFYVTLSSSTVIIKHALLTLQRLIYYSKLVKIRKK